jgi:hypothetical protein
MRSRLEAAFAQRLDTDPIDLGRTWTYEPRCFADEHGQYLPDFAVESTGDFGYMEYIEVKPYDITRDELIAAAGRMQIILASDPGAALAVWTGYSHPRPRFSQTACYIPPCWLLRVEGVPHLFDGELVVITTAGGLAATSTNGDLDELIATSARDWRDEYIATVRAGRKRQRAELGEDADR